MNESKSKLAAYYYCNNLCQTPVSQKKVAELFKVSERSVSQNYKKIFRIRR